MTKLIRAKGDGGSSDVERLRHHFGLERGSTEAKGGRIRLTQWPGGQTQLARGSDFPVSGLCKTKWLNPSVAGV